MQGSRRETIALWIAALAGAVTAPAQALAMPTLPIPDRPMRLLRSIDHDFHDGARLSVLRSWTVEFRRAEGGVDVWGEQSEVSAEGSPQLSAMVERERDRRSAALWPVRLSSSGLILALGSADGGIASPDGPASAAALDRLPDDLFYPSLGPIRSIQAIELPGGAMGEFAVDYEAWSVPDRGWLDRARRRVTTRIGNTREVALERWLLTEI